MTALVIAVATVLAAVAYRTELLGHRARARAAGLAARGLGSAEIAGLASRTGATGMARPSGPWDTPDHGASVWWRAPGVLAPVVVAGAAVVTVLGGRWPWRAPCSPLRSHPWWRAAGPGPTYGAAAAASYPERSNGWPLRCGPARRCRPLSGRRAPGCLSQSAPS